jgi:phosphatidylglycerophosphate synthase
LVGIILVETAMISANRYARVTKNYDLIVSKTGKRAMFARMTAVAWLLFGTAGVGSFFDFVGILGAISGVIGVILGAQALSGYIKQITSLKSS